jgi:hypothetical protein
MYFSLILVSKTEKRVITLNHVTDQIPSFLPTFFLSSSFYYLFPYFSLSLSVSVLHFLFDWIKLELHVYLVEKIIGLGNIKKIPVCFR